MNLVPTAFRHRRSLYVLLALGLAAGVHAASVTGRSIYPDVAFPRIAVIVERGEAPVRSMLVGITQPVEQAVAATPGLRRVRSKTLRGASELSLDFEPNADMDAALSLVRARVAQAGLPGDARTTIERQTPAVFPVISFNVMPGAAARDDAVARARLAEWAEMELRPRLSRLDDTFFVSVQSGDQREYAFEVDPGHLAETGVSIGAVVEAIRDANLVESAGRSRDGGLAYEILVDGQILAPDRIAALAVPREGGRPATLADLGSVVETTVERTSIVTGGRHEGVVVSVFLRDGGQVTRLAEQVTALLGEVASQVPSGGRIEPVYDQSHLVVAAVAGVRDAIVIGAVLAVLVLALFLRSLRLVFVAGLAIPVSVLLTLAVFPLLGETLNLMSLGGLAVAIGLVIDDAIVVCENVARRLQSGSGTPRATVADATREVFGAILGSSLTTVMVFAPLGLLEGVVGQFFRSLSISLAVAVLASTAVSLVYSPLLLLLPGLTPKAGTGGRRWTIWLADRYAGLLRRILAHPGVAGLALAVSVIVGIATLGRVETGFLPEMDEGGLVLDYALPVGTSLEETDAVCRRIERIVLGTPEVASLSRRTGAELGFFATEAFTGDMLIGLTPRERRTRSVFHVIDELRERLAHEAPQAECEFIQVMQDTIADLSGNPEPIEVKLLGPEVRDLQAAADAVESALERVHGVVDVKNHVSFGSPSLTWAVDSEAAARIGLSTAQVAEQVTAQIAGSVATRLPEGNRMTDVRVRYARPWRSSADRPAGDEALFLVPSGGARPTRAVPLEAVAQVSRALEESELERENQTPMVRVTAAVSGRDLGSAARAVERAVAALPRRPGVRVEFGGQVESQRTAFDNMRIVFGVALGLVFLLLVVQFRSLLLPLVVLLALPFGQLGALHALHASHVALNISSGMGLILLVGLVVKNGIILVEYARQLRAEGLDPLNAVIEAARARLRPILMTTLAAILGLVPLAKGIGAGSDLQRPLAIAVIGGLAVSTLFTLLAVPLGLSVLGRRALAEDQADAA